MRRLICRIFGHNYETEQVYYEDVHFPGGLAHISYMVHTCKRCGKVLA